MVKKQNLFAVQSQHQNRRVSQAEVELVKQIYRGRVVRTLTRSYCCLWLGNPKAEWRWVKVSMTPLESVNLQIVMIGMLCTLVS
jgi:hypothetical protein